MFSKEDFKIEDGADFIEFLLIIPFVGVITPFLLVSYAVGFIQKLVGWHQT